jgi:hypothetical protein
MTRDAFPSNTLVGVTTFAGGFETRLILEKALRHFRWRNGNEVSLLVVCDGDLKSTGINAYANHVLVRPERSGLQAGELESLHQLTDFAARKGYRYLVKICGDVIMDSQGWVSSAVGLLRSRERRILSTHWFGNDSWVVGTKFFVAEVAFLKKVLPAKMDAPLLETVLTESIRRQYSLEDVAYLINSTTGESGEVEHELKEWHWEHAHSLSRFRNLDAEAGVVEKAANGLLIYPSLRLIKNLLRYKPKSSLIKSLEFRG